MFSLRTKIIVALASFVLILLGVSATVFIREKQQDVSVSTFNNVSIFAEIVSDHIVRDYEQYQTQKNTLLFEKNVRSVFSKNTAVQSLQIFSYDGKSLYFVDRDADISRGALQSHQDASKNPMLLSQIQAHFPSASTSQGRVIFLKKNSQDSYDFIDIDERPISSLGRSERVQVFVIPVSERYSVAYTLSYDLLDSDIQSIQTRILYLALFGLLLGIAFAVFFASRIHKPVQELIESSTVIAQGDLKHRVDIHSGDEFEAIGRAFNSMAEGVEKTLKDTMYRERVSKELELAAQIQGAIAPKNEHVPADLDISAGLLPALEVGGNFYDFVEGPGNTFFMYMGDATGHGVSAAVLSALSDSLVSAFATLPPVNALAEVNRILKTKIPSDASVSLGLLLWDGNKKTLEFVNAGHQPLFHFHAKDGSVTSTAASGVALGLVPDIQKQLVCEPVALESGDVVLLFSNGLPEAWKNEKENYGLARLKKAFSQHAPLPSALSLRNAILSDIKEFTGSYKQLDDMTLMIVKKK
jgi:serine phosphatase RsbU (regulator of sigma subunit)